MLFTGEYEHTIDDKHRLAIPSDIRSAMSTKMHGDAFYVALGANDVLWLWPEKQFMEIASQLSNSPMQSEDLLEYEVFLFSQARRLELDKTGRVRLPESLISMVGLGSRVTILGVRDHLELRDPEAWAKERQDRFTQHRDLVLGARRALDKTNSNEG
ncbi:MAG: hypothetical protein AAF432_05130 [Planctomycetota bacterium]